MQKVSIIKKAFMPLHKEGRDNLKIINERKLSEDIYTEIKKRVKKNIERRQGRINPLRVKPLVKIYSKRILEVTSSNKTPETYINERIIFVAQSYENRIKIEANKDKKEAESLLIELEELLFQNTNKDSYDKNKECFEKIKRLNNQKNIDDLMDYALNNEELMNDFDELYNEHTLSKALIKNITKSALLIANGYKKEIEFKYSKNRSTEGLNALKKFLTKYEKKLNLDFQGIEELEDMVANMAGNKEKNRF